MSRTTRIGKVGASASSPPPAGSADGTIRILSIDGGGIRGIIPARLLQAIETRTGRKTADLFHLIAGTSTGGIIGCGLLAGKSAQQLADLYVERGSEIFAHSVWRTVTTLDNIAGPKYSAEPLKKVLRETLGDTWLSETRPDTELLVPSYCIRLPKPETVDGVQSTRMPWLFKTWKARGTVIDSGDKPAELDFLLRDIAAATSAAPTYFPPCEIENRTGDPYWMVDGGLFANNPAMCAYTSARKVFPAATRFLVVSLGTGSRERPIDPAHAVGWGDIGWLQPVLSILFDGNSDTVSYEVDQILGSDHLRFEVSLGSDPSNPNAVDDDFDDARPDNIARIERLAQKQIADSKAKLDRLCTELLQPKWTYPLGASTVPIS